MLKVTHSRIPDAFGDTSTVVEHVILSDLAEAWERILKAAGIDPKRADANAALQRLLSLANCVRLSTWGDVYRSDHAKTDLAAALAQVGIEPNYDVEYIPAILH